jgi:tetratricopeptide (TPR) repeat protein
MMMVPHTEPTRSIKGDINAIIGRAEERLGGQPRRMLRGVLPTLRRAGDYDDLKRRLQLVSDDLDACRAALQAALDEAVAAEAAWVGQERFGEVWWKRRQREVEEAFHSSPEEGRRRWLETYTEALVASRFDVCHQMTLRDWPTPADLDLLQTSAAALLEGRHRDAVEGLELLAEASELLLDGHTRSAVLVLLGRIYLYELANLIAARQWIERADTLTPDDGRSAAALGECLRVGGDLDRAQERFTQAIHSSPQLPDGYIGMAMLSEDRQWWHRALDWYDDAIEAAGEAAPFGQLLAPTPGGLYWQIARRLRQRDPLRALEAVDRALELGVRWHHRFPDRRPLADRAAILERLGRPEEAAADYFEAGRRYSWLGNELRARPLLEKACRLDPTHPVARWQLSETLRILSYGRTPPFVEQDLVQRSKEEWEAGTAMRRPDAPTAWAFLGRALLNEQRWKLSKDPELFWESLVFLEGALLLKESYATAWAYLGQYHRVLDNYRSALYATAQALAADPTDVAGLEQRAAALLQVEKYQEAEAAVDQRLQQAEEWWAVAVKASILLRTGRVEEALPLLNRAIDAVPEDAANRSLRALCLRLLGQEDQATEDYRWIWERRDAKQATTWSSHTVAWAGYMLGEFDAAASRIETALQEGAVDAASLWCDLGQVRLARGDPKRDDVPEGERALAHGIDQIRGPSRLTDLVEFDLDLLERTLVRRSGTGPAVAALTRIRARVEQARERLARPMTADQELRSIADTATPGSNRWLAATAFLARSAGTAGRWSEALDAYVALNASGSFPEAKLGLVRAIDQLKREADQLVLQGQVAEARTRLQGLLSAAEAHLGEHADLTFELYLRAGLTALDQGEDEAARRHLDPVVSSGQVEDRLDELAALEQSFLRTPRDYWKHVDGLRRIQERYGDPSPERVTLDALIARLDLSRLYRLAVGDADTFPIATPLALRVGHGFKQTDPDGWAALSRALKELRRRIGRETGIPIPGVRLSESGTLGPGDYVVLIDATPVARGTLPVDGRFILEDGGQQPVGRRIRDPLTGRWGVWVERPPGRHLGEAPLRPLGFVERHLEATIRRGLACFIGLDDIQA